MSMLSLIAYEFLGTAILLFAGLYLYYKLVVFKFWKNKNVYSPDPTFPTGNALPMVTGKKSPGEVLAELYLQHKKLPFIGLYMFFKPNLFVNDLDLVKFVLTKEFGSFHDRGMYCNENIDPLSGHLFLLPGKKWRNLRVKLTPTFTSGKIKQMFQILKESGDGLAKFLDREASISDSLEIKDIFARYSTDNIMSTAFGINSNSMENPDCEFRYWGKKAFEPKAVVNTFTMFAPKVLEIFSVPFTDKGVTKFFMNAFEETVKYREKHNVVRKDFLNLIMQLMKNGYVEPDEDKSNSSNQENGKANYNKLTMEEGAAQAYVFFVAGFETSSTAATHCLYELALHQEIQDKTREEINATLKKYGGLTYDSINDMPYLTKVINETMRKYPPVPVLNRICTKKVQLPNSDVVIPEGTTITIPIFGIQNDPDIFPDPEKFDPERFSEENVAARHSYAFLPFGEGPRVCIGMRFGLVQTKIALVSALTNFRFKPSKKTQVPLIFDGGSLILTPVDGINLKVEKICERRALLHKVVIIFLHAVFKMFDWLKYLLLNFIIAISFLLCLFYLYCKFVAFEYWKKLNVPHIEPIFPLGNLLPFVSGKIAVGDFMKDAYLKFADEQFFGIYTFHRPNFIPVHPEVLKFILAKEFSSFHDRGLYCDESLDPLTGHLFLNSGKKWRNLRVKLTPTFTSGKIKQMFPVLKSSGEQLRLFLDSQVEKSGSVEIKETFARYSTDVIMCAAFGADCNSLLDPESEFRYWGKKFFAPRPLKNTLILFVPKLMQFLRIPATDPGVSSFFIKIFQMTVGHRREQGLVKKDFLNLIMQLMDRGYVDVDDEKDSVDLNLSNETKKLTMLEGAAQAFVFFLAGFETSSSTATHCMYEMALNPDIQETLHEEIVSMVNKHGSLSYEAINEMTYLHKVISETLRKYPSLPILNRVVTKTAKLPNSDVTLPEGTLVMVSVIGLHHDPKYYPEPDKFDPERFSDEAISSRPPYTYLPFGEGPRICIGMRFGMIQTKVAVANALYHFKFSRGPETPYPLKYDKGIITMTPKSQVNLLIERRSK
ncbi:uncharacterized protein [Prorops nasuta]|uniref:uncharacterized protein n=1 Tax=Prorops nasuta TaxID=863751 RepID=UPI0034CE1FE0